MRAAVEADTGDRDLERDILGWVNPLSNRRECEEVAVKEKSVLGDFFCFSAGLFAVWGAHDAWAVATRSCEKASNVYTNGSAPRPRNDQSRVHF